MKNISLNSLRASVILLLSVLSVACFEDNDDNAVSASQISDFVWKGMNIFRICFLHYLIVSL